MRDPADMPIAQAPPRPPPSPLVVSSIADAGALPTERPHEERPFVIGRGAPNDTTGWQHITWLDDHRLLLSGSDMRVYDVTSRATTVLVPKMVTQATMIGTSHVLAYTDTWDVFSTATLTKTATIDCGTLLSIGPRGGIACRVSKGDEVRLFDIAGAPSKPIATVPIEDDKWTALAVRLSTEKNLVLDGNVFWRADTGQPIVAAQGFELSLGGGGAYVYSSLGGSVIVLKLGAREARKVECDGALTYALDPKLPLVYGTQGEGHGCTVDLTTGRMTTQGRPPPPRKTDCCGSPHLTARSDGLAFEDAGFVWHTLIDAKSGAPIKSGGEQLTAVAHADARGLLLIVVASELVAFDTRARVEKWRRPIFAMTGTSPEPAIASSPDGTRLALIRYYGDAEPTIVDVASGRIVSPPDALDAAIFGDDGALSTRAASGAIQRWDLASGAVADATSFPTKKHGVRSELRERCQMQVGGPELDASPDGVFTACFRAGRVVVVAGEGGTRIDIEPRASMHGGVVYGDDDSFDLVGNESAIAAALVCRAGDRDLPLDSCAAKLRRRGLLKVTRPSTRDGE
jgi:hypothetical protein